MLPRPATLAAMAIAWGLLASGLCGQTEPAPAVPPVLAPQPGQPVPGPSSSAPERTDLRQRNAQPQQAQPQQHDADARQRAAELKLRLAEAKAKVDAAMKSADPVDQLRGLLTEENSAETRRGALAALGGVRDPRAVDPLFEMVENSDHKIANLAAESLKSYPEQASPRLIKLLEHPSTQVRTVAASTLRDFRDERAIDGLARLLRDPEPHLRETAWGALHYLGDSAKPALREALISTDMPLCDDAKLRAQILPGAVSGSEPETLALLEKMQSDPQPEVRALAFRVMNGRSLSTEVELRLIEHLPDHLDDPDPRCRAAVVHSIGHMAQRGYKFNRSKVIPDLLQTLNDPEKEVRLEAVQALGQWRVPETVEPLIPLLDDPALRDAVIFSLGRIGDPRAIPALRKGLDQKQYRVLYALGELHDRESVPAIIPLLQHTDKSTRAGAAQALGKMDDPRAVEPLIQLLKTTSDDELISTLATALGQLDDPRAVQPLLTAYLKPRRNRSNAYHDHRVREIEHPGYDPVADGVRMLGLVTQPAMIAALQGNNSKTKLLAAWILEGWSERKWLKRDLQAAAEPLAALLSADDISLKFYVAMTLARIEDRRAAPALLELAAIPDLERWKALDAAEELGKLDYPGHKQVMLAWLQSDSLPLRCRAARALGFMGDQRAIEPLLAALKYEPTPQPPGPRLSRQAQQRGTYEPYEEQDYVNSEVIRALQQLEAREAVEPLLDLLAQEKFPRRREAISALGFLGDPRAVEPLAKLAATETDVYMRVSLVYALWRLGDPRGVELMTDCLKSKNPHLRRHATHVLSEIKFPIQPLSDTTIDLLIAEFDRSDEENQWAPARALGRFGGPRGIDALLARTNDPKNLPAIMLGLVRSKDDRAWETIRTQLAHVDPDVRREAAWWLAESDDVRNAAPLIAMLEDSESKVRIAAIGALVYLRAKQAIDPIEPLLEDPDPRVRFYAERGLDRLNE